MIFNLFGGAEPKDVSRGAAAYISAQERQNRLSILAFVKLLLEPLDCVGRL